jgi:hypothetical protein
MSVGLRIVADTPQGRLHDERSAMSTAVLARTREPFPVAVPGLTISPAAPDLWRVARQGGAVVGHIVRSGRDESERYLARRVLPGGIRSIDLGEFWSPREAAELFR